jgi:hypothetical protein
MEYRFLYREIFLESRGPRISAVMVIQMSAEKASKNASPTEEP